MVLIKILAILVLALIVVFIMVSTELGYFLRIWNELKRNLNSVDAGIKKKWK